MPYKSERQRRFMHARHPEIAKRWDKEYGAKVERSAPKGHAGSSKAQRGSPGKGRRIG